MSDTEKELEYSRRVQKEVLISLVEDRPVLWDKTLDIYKSKADKATAWREICVALMDNYNDLEIKERQEFVKFVIKKWSQTRDAWIRTLKEEKRTKKTGIPTKHYRYHDQMLFLKKVVLNGEHFDESSPNTQKNEQIKFKDHRTDDNEWQKIVRIEETTSIKKRKPNSEIGEERSSAEHCNAKKPACAVYEDRNLTFFKSLLPSLALLDDDQTLEFHSGVLHLLQSIKRRPNYHDWARRPQGSIEHLPQSPSAISLVAQSPSSELQDRPFRVKVEMESND